MPDTIVHTTGVPAAREQKVEIAYAVQLGLTTLPRAKRSLVEAKISSLKMLQKLAKTADRGGENGRLFIADVSASVRAVYRFTPTGAEVVDLISKRAFGQLFGGSKPVRRPKAKKTFGAKSKFPLS